jgi:DnaJ-class molecular chaperone
MALENAERTYAETRARQAYGVRPCPKCDGDGWIDIMDPDHDGAVLGARACPRCGGEGVLTTPYDDEAYLKSIPVEG